MVTQVPLANCEDTARHHLPYHDVCMCDRHTVRRYCTKGDFVCAEIVQTPITYTHNFYFPLDPIFNIELPTCPRRNSQAQLGNHQNDSSALPEKMAHKLLVRQKLANHGVGGDSSKPFTMAVAKALMIKRMQVLIKQSMALLVQPQPAPVTLMPVGYFDPIAPPQLAPQAATHGEVSIVGQYQGLVLNKFVVRRQAQTTRRVGLSVFQGSRYWMLGNKVAGTDMVPVGSYRDIASTNLSGPIFKRTRKFCTELAFMFRNRERQL